MGESLIWQPAIYLANKFSLSFLFFCFLFLHLLYMSLCLPVMANEFSILSYNLHGFGSGLGMLPDLCKLHTVVAVQEHWLSDDGLMKLNDIDINCRSYAVSAMTDTLSAGYLTGRPYGGVGIIWHKNLGNRVSLLGSDSTKRCIAIKIKISDSLEVVIVNVYLP